MPRVHNQTFTANEATDLIDQAPRERGLDGLRALAADWGQHDGTDRTVSQWMDYLYEYAADRWPYDLSKP